MRDPVVVVGSGASGVHFAQTALERGRRVRMIDVGFGAPEVVAPDEDLSGLKSRLPDPLAYFLGEDFGSLVLPGHEGEYYGFPPSKEHVFRDPGGLAWRAEGFAPLYSFAQGGLAEAWTGGCYPFHDGDLADFPFRYEDLAPWYETVARRIGVTGAADDLSPFLPVHGGLLEPLEADAHARDLLDGYAARRERLRSRYGFHLGRSRSSVLSRPHGGRPACDLRGRCLWGCPTGAFYTPSVTLRELRARPGFEYVAGVRVERFLTDGAGRIDRVVGTELPGGAAREFAVGSLVLAAGTLCTARIFLESARLAGGAETVLPGLSDNRQVLVPFVNRRMLGRAYEPRSYQYHQLAFAIAAAEPREHLHGLVTTLKTAMAHPIVSSIPVSLRTALAAFRDVRAALGLVNLNFPDSRRPDNLVALETGSGGASRLVVTYRPEAGEAERVERGLRTVRDVLGELGCVAPRGLAHVRPMGASVHYTGTLPMGREPRPRTVDPDCRSRDFENLWVADGSTFPWLPAKNLTFTLMANASRIAAAACG